MVMLDALIRTRFEMTPIKRRFKSVPPKLPQSETARKIRQKSDSIRLSKIQPTHSYSRKTGKLQTRMATKV